MSAIDHFSCPLPKDDHQQILLAHGAGGTLSQKLLQQVILPHFDNPLIRQQHDGAMVDIDGLCFAFSTDSYVVQPLFFPGGDIGELAVNGTVNDLAMCGAQPRYLSCGLIIEEGLEMEMLRTVFASMQKAAQGAGVQIVTGDTKVVDKGKGDKLFINTSGIGVIPAGRNISPMNCRIGDQVIISGRIAEHGMAVMSAREGIHFGGDIASDTAALNSLVERMFAASENIHVLRDPTRGGVASALNEIAQAAQIGITIRESDIPIAPPVKAACEILGLDPLYVANEGKLLALVDSADADRILKEMQKDPLGGDARIIGEVTSAPKGRVVLHTCIGGRRIVDMLSGDQLPRIC